MSWSSLFEAVYNTVGCTCCLVSFIMPCMFLGFTSAANLKMTFAILNERCLMYFLFIHLIFSAEVNIHVFQKPRFIGVKTGRTVTIYCVTSDPSLTAQVEWYKDPAYKNQLKNGQKIRITEKSDKMNASITVKKVEIEDSGTYFCKLNKTNGPGTELQVSSRYHFVNVIRLLSSLACIHVFLCFFSRIQWPQDYPDEIESQGCFHFPAGYTVDFVCCRSSGSYLQTGKGHSISTSWFVHFPLLSMHI